jgi:hypothetical protein
MTQKMEAATDIPAGGCAQRSRQALGVLRSTIRSRPCRPRIRAGGVLHAAALAGSRLLNELDEHELFDKSDPRIPVLARKTCHGGRHRQTLVDPI